MKKFRVTVEEVIVYKVELEAEDEEQAKADAVEAIINAENRDEEYFFCVNERDATDVEELE
jgi:hypothetical protein